MLDAVEKWGPSIPVPVSGWIVQKRDGAAGSELEADRYPEVRLCLAVLHRLLVRSHAFRIELAGS
jgi:hypothetical protein